MAPQSRRVLIKWTKTLLLSPPVQIILTKSSIALDIDTLKRSCSSLCHSAHSPFRTASITPSYGTLPELNSSTYLPTNLTKLSRRLENKLSQEEYCERNRNKLQIQTTSKAAPKPSRKECQQTNPSKKNCQ